jgi:asparagine synthase (glutamine-hydrolysing)
MCGIAGCLALADGAGPDSDWVGSATRSIAHRGPDDDGYYSDADIALGFKRLAIIDLSAAGHQPMRSADGRYWMVFNGEIYNYIELAAQLRQRGVVLRSSSDSEVLLETYAQVGKDVVRRLRGMYAFAIWDTWNKELFCARDPFGIKPFFYAVDDVGRRTGRGRDPGAPEAPFSPAAPYPTAAQGGGWFAGQPDPRTPGPGRPGPMLRFASERKALARPGEVAAIDPDALRRYLSFQYVPPPATMTPPVRSLPPGHALVARVGGTVDVFRYWRPELRPSKSPGARTPESILEVMRDSVAVHLRSDAPLGAFLSGGIDSAAICALVAESRPDLLTFTVGFDRPGYSEIDRAQETAAALGVKSIPYVITPQEFLARLPQIIWHLDDPMADAAAIPLWFVAREASRYVKVVLSGEGADELFGGYAIYHQPVPVRAGEVLPEWGRAPFRRAAAALPPGVRGKGLLERMSTPLQRRYIGNANVFTEDQVNWVTRLGRGSPFDVTDPVYRQAAENELDDVATMQLVDISTWLPGDILVKADRVTMAHGLELRVPFLDREVMAVAARLARVEKTAAGTTKFALREAMSSVLPKAAAERAKLGFPVPIGQWLKGDMYGFAEQVLREARTDQWLDKNAVMSMLRRYADGDPEVSWRHLWVLIVFSLWHQIYVERVYDPVALGWER